MEEAIDEPSSGAGLDGPPGNDGDDGLGDGGGGLFNGGLADVIRLYGEFATDDLPRALRAAGYSREADDLEGMLVRVDGQRGFEAVARQLQSLPTAELEPVGLAGVSGDAKCQALTRAIDGARSTTDENAESTFRRVIRWGKYFWGSVKSILGVFFPQLKNLMDAIDELLDYADNVLADSEEGWLAKPATARHFKI